MPHQSRKEERISDVELVKRLVAKDRAAFEMLVDRYEAPLFRFVRRRSRSETCAEDALQETFLSLWRRGTSGAEEPIDAVRAWLYQVARNAVLRNERRRVDEPANFDSLETLEALGAAAGWGSVVDDPSHWASVRESKIELHTALDQLDVDDREIIQLRDIDGLSAKEAAHVLDSSTAAVKSRLHRARLRLVGQLRRTFNEE